MQKGASDNEDQVPSRPQALNDTLVEQVANVYFQIAISMFAKAMSNKGFFVPLNVLMSMTIV